MVVEAAVAVPSTRRHVALPSRLLASLALQASQWTSFVPRFPRHRIVLSIRFLQQTPSAPTNIKIACSGVRLQVAIPYHLNSVLNSVQQLKGATIILTVLFSRGLYAWVAQPWNMVS